MKETTHVWAVIQQWMDDQPFPPKPAQLAAKLKLSRSAVSQWKHGQSRPKPEHLRELARVMHVPYERLLTALMVDMGYLEREERGRGSSAPNTPAERVWATEPDPARPQREEQG